MILPLEWSDIDRLAGSFLLPLGLWILFSGLDDLIVDVSGFFALWRERAQPRPARRELLRTPEQRIAIFIPCWQESSVIAAMITRNRETVHYASVDFFVGAYPNDTDTVAIVTALEQRLTNVHLALCPHPGPTSKADCLNWIYQRMLLCEDERAIRFDVVVTHDAEDVVHPESLQWINWYSREYDMVQIPVLPLPTPVRMWTHGVYCDEFAEYQCRDMPVRQFMGAFVPSNGVGTGFRRSALEELARFEGNRIFEPVCLTEDYENGFRLKLHGAKQIFVRVSGEGVATREYFPVTFRTAVRQRTRWVTGIALQTWERHGWKGSLADKYWLWRDRKGLIGNPATLLTNLLFAYGAVFGTITSVEGWDWAFGNTLRELAPLFACTTVLGVYRLLFRMVCVGRSFGWMFAFAVPVRVVVANGINSLATMRALFRYAVSRVRREPLRWVKTEHQFPTAAALRPERRLVGQILLAKGYLEENKLEYALATKRDGVRLGEHLITLGYVSEDEVCEALSAQAQVPQTWVKPPEIRTAVARALPAHIAREWNVLPFRIEDGKMLIASSDVPSATICGVIGRYTNLEMRFHLVTPSHLKELTECLL